MCAVGHKKTPINSNANKGREMKNKPIKMNYFLLQFDVLIILRGPS